MDFDKDSITNFVTALQNRNNKKSLYGINKAMQNSNSSQKRYKASDVVVNVTKQLKALHNADKIKKYQRKENPINKFETQCVSDTQLITIIKNFEAVVDAEKGITQEFNTTFYHKDCPNEDIQTKKEFSKEENTISTPVIFSHNNKRQIKIPYKPKYTAVDFESNTFEPVVSSAKEKFDHFTHNQNSNDIEKLDIMNMQSINNEICRYSEVKVICDSKTIKYDVLTGDQNSENEKSNSKISSTINYEAKSNTLSPLVFKLESFEMFESMALPVVSENPDYETAKKLINSQILERQLYIHTHAEPVLSDRDKQHSPILEVKNKNLQNFEFHSNCLSKSKMGSLIEDSILFSSDEEDNIKKKFEELPSTCTLQNSFCNKPNILDKTIYVGFQTASNKSIQICSDSFNKAKNMFDNIVQNDEDSLSLKKLAVYSSSSTESNINPVKVATNHNDKSKIKNSNMRIPVVNLECVNIESTISEKGYFYSEDTENLSNNLKPVKFKNYRSSLENNFMPCGNEKISRQVTEVNKNNNCDIEIVSNDLNVFSLETFKMASNREIKVSQHVSLETKNNIGSIELNILQQNKNCPNVSPNKKIPNDILSDAKYVESKTGCIGLKRANNKRLKISKDTIHKSEKIPQNTNYFANISNTDTEKIPAQSAEIFHGFKTASNKPIEISDLALSKSKKLFQNMDISDSGDSFPVLNGYNLNENLPYPDHNKATIGIKKKIETDRDLKAKITHNESLGRFTQSLNETENIRQETFIHNNIKKTINPICNIRSSSKFQGFKTASNKPVNITEKSLALTKNIFKDIDIDNIKENKIMNNLSDISKEKVTNTSNRTVSKSVQGFNCSVTNKKNSLSEKVPTEIIEEDVNVNDKSLITDAKFDINVKEEKYMSRTSGKNSLLLGFKTASNKSVKISTKMLEKSKHIFKDLVSGDCNGEKNDGNGEKLGGKPPYPSFNCITRENQPKYRNNISSNYTLQGFQTANNKPVMISTDAIAKSKKVFEDMDIGCVKKQKINYVEINEMKPMTQNNFNGFPVVLNKEINISKKNVEVVDLEQNLSHLLSSKERIDIAGCDTGGESILSLRTGNTNRLKISDDTLFETRKLFDNQIDKTEVPSVPKYKRKIDLISENEIEENIFDTEVIKDFENTVYTEDFIPDTPKSKRSGSPILSCPKAKKKKKFETPLNTNKFIAPINLKHTVTSHYMYNFMENYKKNKKYSIKDINEIEKVKSDVKIDNCKKYIQNFQFDTLLDFEFNGPRNDINSDMWTTDKIMRRFTNSVNKNIIPEGWMENHLKLIIWKLLSYEIRFRRTMTNVCSVKNVLEQLKFRYDRELYNVQRPALRKILEKDEVSTKRIILCVAGLFLDGVKVSSVTYGNQNIELLLTDGWYCIKACTDRMIDKLVCDGKIAVGTKLAIQGAELLNCDQGIAPWEDTSSIRLKIFGNSTRPAKWYARLGFCGNGAILTRLSNVKLEGGKISQLRVLITRVYPMLYIEKFADGSTVTRSERLEHLYQMKYETEQQIQLEKLYEEAEKFSDQESQDSEGVNSREKETFNSDSQILRLLKKNKDRDDFSTILTSSQAHHLEQHMIKVEEKRIQRLQKKVQELMKKRGLCVARNVVPLMKVRVADVENGKMSKAMITIWRPNEMLQEIITEGTWINLYNVVPTAIRYSEIQISGGRQSVFVPLKRNEIKKLNSYKETLKRKCYTIKDLQNPSINIDYNEIDTVGLIFLIEPTTEEFEMKNQQFQNMYLTDADKNILCVNFWGGIRKYGFENMLKEGQVITCVNLQRRAGNTRKNIPQYRATEYSFFTKTSKNDSVRKIADYLTEKFSSIDKRKFINDCLAIRNNYHNINYGNIENISPYRMNNIDCNISKNKMFIDSPLASKCGDVNVNLSGLDFESTFKQSDTQNLSPTILLRKKKLNQKIAKLEMYGEPPPLAAIHIINKSSDAVKPFRSPFTKIDIPTSVTSANSVPQNQEESLNSSPVLPLNKTYVKRTSINPVKLDFSRVIEDKMTMDAFAEEFDGSPPLSLDCVL